MMKGTPVIRAFCIALILFTGSNLKELSGQQLLDDRYILQMKQDMQVLATDSLEGREAGSMGELYAALYIADRFELLGLKTWFDGCYYQDFDFSDGVEYLPETNHLGVSYFIHEEHVPQALKLSVGDFTPLSWGSDGVVSGLVVDAGFCLKDHLPTKINRGKSGKKSKNVPFDPLAEMAGKIVLARFDAPSDYAGSTKNVVSLMVEKAQFAAANGALAVIFHDPDQIARNVPGTHYPYDQTPIPVIFMHDADKAANLPVSEVQLTVTSSRKRGIGKNVVAWIDNGAPQTVLIGAHYDHLGWGIGNSRHDGLPEIHYGADDNASGVTGMLVLAQWLQESNLKGKNYLFAAFSAEEKGLIGSRVLAEHESISNKHIFAMINFDMIGRVNIDKPEIQILASGSSPAWEGLLSLVKEDVKSTPVKSGLNGSDHHHFYKDSIPVLFFFNGIHDDYHKPTDVIEKINYNGLRDVVEYTILLLHHLDTLSVLPYERVEEAETSSRRGGKTSLGIIPAHGVDVEGLLVQDVIPQRPAALAGIIKGDIIVQLAGVEVKNIQHYMKALDLIKEGQQVPVTILRDKISKQFILQF
jgi:aminopeptidase YwaD